MMRLWVPVGLVLSITLAGFVLPGDPVSSPASASSPDASPPGLVRVVENADPDRTLLVGFDLDLHEDDWQEWASSMESELALAPFGELDGWGVYIFDHDGQPVRLITSMPSHGVIYPLGTPVDNEASMSTWITWFYEREPTTYRVVVALVGAGGVALAPSPDWEETPTAEELLALPSAVPTPIGVGTGLSAESHLDVTVLGALGGQVTAGTPDVSYGGPLSSQVPTPLLDLDVATQAAGGWSYLAGGYLGYESKGLWEATIAADETYAYSGVVVQDWVPPFVLLAETLVLGLPIFSGHGATVAPVTAEFNVTVTNVDYLEFYYLDHLALGAPLDELIGVSGPDFDVAVWEGLLGLVTDLLVPQYTMEGDALVTRIGDLESVTLGVPPHVQDALQAIDA